MDNERPIRVAIAHSKSLFVNLLDQFFKQHPNLEVVFTADQRSDLEEALFEQPSSIDVLLLEANRDQMNYFPALSDLKEQHPDLNLIVICRNYKHIFVGHYIKEGASAVLSQKITPHDLIQAIEAVYQRNHYFLSEQLGPMRDQLNTMSRQAKRGQPISITKREKEVLALLCEQKTAREIADFLYLTKRTVEGYKNRLLSKTGAKNTAGLIIYAIKEGIVDVGSLRLG